MRARSVLVLFAGNAAAKALTFLAGSVVLAWLFGADGGTDALLVAQVLPAYLVYFLTWATASALVPVLAEVRLRRSEEEARRVAGGVLWAGVGLASLAGATLSAAAPLYLPHFGPGFTPGQAGLAVELARILFLSLPFHAVAAVGGALLVSAGRPGGAGAVVALGPAAQLAALLVLHRSLGIEAAAWAFLAGPAAQAALALPLVARARVVRLRAPVLRDPAVAQVGRLMVPGLVGAASYAAYLAVFRGAGTLLPDGSLTALDYAEKLAQGVPLLAVAAVGTAILPELSGLAARGETAGLAAALERAAEALAAWVAPLAVALALFGDDLAGLLFGHGRFPPEMVAVTAACLLVLAPRTAGLGLGQLVEQGLFALQRPRFAFFASLGGFVVGLGCALGLSHRFGVLALAAGQTGAFLTQLAVGGVLLARLLGGALPVRAILAAHLRALALALGAGGLGLGAVTAAGLEGATRPLAGLGVALALYLALAPAAGVRGVVELGRRIRSRLSPAA